MRNTAKKNAWQYCHSLAFGHQPRVRSPASRPIDPHRNVIAWRRAGIRHIARVYVDPIPAIKRQLGHELARDLDGWRAVDIASVIETEPARVSDLRRGRLERFSLETLIRYCSRLGRSVAVSVGPRRFRKRG
jgi:predicted XRE-type DNA-binding protein